MFFSNSPPLVNPKSFPHWILHEDDNLLVLDKPGWLVCHPSKNGPYSSLVGAARAYTGLDRMHLISRLDRETSGVVVLAKNPETASRYQKLMETRQTAKTYLAFLSGQLSCSIQVCQPIGPAINVKVVARQAIRHDLPKRRAVTHFKPIVSTAAYSFVEVIPVSGRQHQIRVHAQWLGHSIVGDKIYGPDESLFLQFIEDCVTPGMLKQLILPRQALHASSITFKLEDAPHQTFKAPLASDLVDFAESLGLSI